MNYLLNILEKKFDSVSEALQYNSFKSNKKVNNNDKTFEIGVTIMPIYKRWGSSKDNVALMKE